MTIRKIVLTCGIFLLLLSPVIAYQYWEELWFIMGVPMLVDSEGIPRPVDAMGRIREDFQPDAVREFVDFLQQQSLDETFGYLLDDQQYLAYPSYHPQTKGVPVELERLLSSRAFLKTFQQFGELSREEALEKLPLFCDRAIETFEASLVPNSDTYISMIGAKYMVCTSMLLAACMGESEWLLYQLDRMQFLVDKCAENDEIQLNHDMLRLFALLEDDCLFTVLMYALKQTGADWEINIPDTVRQKSIPLCHWNALATYHDKLARGVAGVVAIHPDDCIEQLDVYEFPIDFDDWQKKALIATLIECLSM